MEDFPILLISLIVYLVAASSGRKKKKRRSSMQRRSSRRMAAQGELHDDISAARSAQTQRGFAQAFEQATVAPQEAARGTEQPLEQEACERSPIHLHAVSQAQMQLAAEGEDPCHAGGMKDKDGEENDVCSEERSLAQDILRGVIMSEILTRPQERAAHAAWRKNGQGYNG